MENAKAITRQFFVWVVICVLLTITCPAQTSPATEEIVAKADQYMNALVRLGRFSGTILVARDGHVLLRKGYDMANLEQDVPNAPQTKFRLGSVSKQFNAMAIMLLQERGKLSMQDSVCKYVLIVRPRGSESPFIISSRTHQASQVTRSFQITTNTKESP